VHSIKIKVKLNAMHNSTRN